MRALADRRELEVLMQKNETTTQYRACILGASLGTGNMGVSALAASVFQLVMNTVPHARVAFMIGNQNAAPQTLDLKDRKIPIEIVNYRLSPRARFHEHLFAILLLAFLYRFVPAASLRGWIARRNRWIQSFISADFIGDISGGDSFSDIYGVGKFVTTTLPSIIALILRKRLVLLPQTYGPYNSAISRAVARFIIKRAHRVVSRDKESFAAVGALLGESFARERVRFCPDVAFTLPGFLPEEIDVRPALPAQREVPLIGINVNGLMYHGGYTRNNMFGLKLDYQAFVKGLVERLLAETPARLLLVPHTFVPAGNVNSDPAACEDVLRSMTPAARDRMHLVARQYDQCRIKGVIGLCDFFIGSRMHSCIAAISQGIPTVAVAYSKKFIGVFNSAGLGDMVIDARAHGTGEAIEALMNCFGARQDAAGRLTGKIAELQASVAATFRDLLNGDASGGIRGTNQDD